MKYLVKNCPCYTSKGGYYDCWANQDTWCENITDCVVKRVIEKLENPNNRTYGGRPLVFTEELIQLFDIEEINK